MTRTITLKELRPKLPQIIQEIDSKMDRFIITKRGKPAALMMAVEDFESIMETLEIMSDRKLMKKIRRSQEEIKEGKVIEMAELERKLGIV